LWVQGFQASEKGLSKSQLLIVLSSPGSVKGVLTIKSSGKFKSKLRI
jgi:hypothetical protein